MILLCMLSVLFWWIQIWNFNSSFSLLVILLRPSLVLSAAVWNNMYLRYLWYLFAASIFWHEMAPPRSQITTRAQWIINSKSDIKVITTMWKWLIGNTHHVITCHHIILFLLLNDPHYTRQCSSFKPGMDKIGRDTTQIWATSECTQIILKYMWCKRNHMRQC